MGGCNYKVGLGRDPWPGLLRLKYSLDAYLHKGEQEIPEIKKWRNPSADASQVYYMAWIPILPIIKFFMIRIMVLQVDSVSTVLHSK